MYNNHTILSNVCMCLFSANKVTIAYSKQWYKGDHKKVFIHLSDSLLDRNLIQLDRRRKCNAHRDIDYTFINVK